ncbi:HtaA domain-containing protein [Streptomyces sp. NPDC020412]|uniref:HtaA domain-containing protein n=1 Tax=Streptomyces sp. NPDC020412 TaxID=3365073 RepID=UPI0037A8B897
MSATRRPLAVAAATATAVALGATALSLPAFAAGSDARPTAASSSSSAPSYELTEGTLDWGFKESFRKHVVERSEGTITVADGARQAAGNGPFAFTGGTGVYDMSTHGVRTAFNGSVTFDATKYGYTIGLADLKLTTNRTSGFVTADVTAKGATKQDVQVAALDLTGKSPGQGAGGAMVFKDIPATLTAEGATALGMYKAGEELDAVTLTVKAEMPNRPSPDPDPDPEPTQPSPEPSGKPSGPPAAPDGTIVDGNLDWGVKERFRSYVTTGMAKGKIEVSGGAKTNAAGFRFPKGKGTFDPAKKSLDASFGGGVRFLGHEIQGSYLLDLKLSDLKVRVAGAKGTLLADVSTKDKTTGKVSTHNDLGLATLTVPANALTAKDKLVQLTGVPAKLTADGSKAFSGMYQPGEELDKVNVAVALDKSVKLPDATSGGSSSGGSSSGGSASGGSSSGGTTGGGSVGGAVGGGSVGGAVSGAADGSGGGAVGGGTGGALANTGADVPVTGLLAAAAGIAAAGAGAVVLARRRGQRGATG